MSPFQTAVGSSSSKGPSSFLAESLALVYRSTAGGRSAEIVTFELKSGDILPASEDSDNANLPGFLGLLSSPARSC